MAVWYNGEVEFIGCTGADSIRAMAVQIGNGDHADILELIGLEETASLDDIEAELTDLGVSAQAVPLPFLHQERWDPERTFILDDLSDPPGRGYTKVLGVHI